jgi:hypothetical protein
MLLEVSVSPKKTIFFKYNRHLILIRLQQTYMEILIVISSMLKYLLLIFYHCVRHDLDLQLPVQSVPIITKVVSSNHAHGEVYSIQHYVIKFASDLRQVSGFLWFSPPIKLTATI